MNNRVWVLKPKYNRVYECSNMVEAEELINSEGGCCIKFDHYPTEEERERECIAYYS